MNHPTPRRQRLVFIAFSLAALLLAARPCRADESESASRERFEKEIRPVLVERCYECHNSTTQKKGGLALDCREALLAGGDSGPAIIPGSPDKSRLIRAIAHADSKLKMPKGGPKLDDKVVASFSRWIQSGAFDPRDRAPTAQQLAQQTGWEAVRARRMQWWSFQPIVRPPLPPVGDAHWPVNPVDRFVLAKLEAEHLAPAAEADRPTLIRRVTFALTGLPPTPAEIDAFCADPSGDAYEKVVDRLLASPQFGERWARHIMDWFRYADTHGSEGDPPIPYAWRYRDYLIRALNADVPYDQLVREQLAGDLLPTPRIDPATGLNESALGITQYRFVQHGYAPTDALDEQICFTDNQIDVISKALLGVTVSCARCHNHKFDPISQTDFYALYGIMISARPAVICIDPPNRDKAQREKMLALKGQIRQAVARAWLKTADEFPDRLLAAPAVSQRQPPPVEAPPARKKKGQAEAEPVGWQAAIDESATYDGRRSPLHPWTQLRDLSGDSIKSKWKELAERQSADRDQAESGVFPLRWRLGGGDLRQWYRYGNGLGDATGAAGEFAVLPDGPGLIGDRFSPGAYSDLISSKDNAVLTSPRFKITTDEILFRAAGQGARLRLVVDNYPRADGPIFPTITLNSDAPHWFSLATKYWKGEWAYLEAATAADAPIPPQFPAGRSWFGVSEVVGRSGPQPPLQEPAYELAPLDPDGPVPADAREVAALYGRALRSAVEAWWSGHLTDSQAFFLGYLLRRGLLPNSAADLPEAAPLVADYRDLENTLPGPTRAAGVTDGDPVDQPLFIRGDHQHPAQPVARRFLEALDPRPYHTAGSGRLQLADSIVAPSNPLTARVIANRLWHHLFGVGIVSTPDNLGQLGELPTNQPLLDFLASDLRDNGWSLKRSIRQMVLSRAYRLGSEPSPQAIERDPGNRLLSHFRVHRLEAEAIRDNLLATAGALDRQMFGESVDAAVRRRSLYIRIDRLHLTPFLAAFDAPQPSATQGRREVTNVPAQSLTLLNDPFVIDLSQGWAQRIVHDPPDPTQRAAAMFKAAMGRAPSDEECNRLLEYLNASSADYAIAPADVSSDVRPWRDLAQAIFNLKEFIYIR